MKAIARRRDGYAHDVEIDGRHSLVIDEPAAAGGTDLGPTPMRTLMGALAACTAITCEMYAGHKGWNLGDVSVEVDAEFDKRQSVTECKVTVCIPEPLTAEQQERLLVIAGKCPVHRALASETPIDITDHIDCPNA